MSADKSPAEKLPLAARKNVRDGWERKKEGFESQLTTLLGVPWTFEINPLVVYPYAEEGSYGHGSLGDCIHAYVDGFVWNLKSFIEKYGDAGKEELNSVASSHVITLEASPAVSYCGTDFVDNKFRIVFHPDKLGSNISHAGQDLAAEISAAPQPAGAPSLSFTARASIAADYEPKIGAVLEKARKLLQNPNFEFEPGFEALGSALKSGEDVRDDWEQNLGDFARRYFEAVVDVLEREKFGEDEMLREGLEEAVPKAVLRLKVLEKIGGSYNETLLEDGALVVQTTPGNWGTNIHYAGEKIVDLL